MLYDNYESKIKKLVITRNFIIQHKIIIMIIIGIIMTLNASFLGTKGIIIDDISCPTQIVYGDDYSYGAKALFADVSFEFSEEGTNKWSNVKPSMPGSYLIRTVTNRSFGIKSYGTPQAFVLEPKEIMPIIPNAMMQYGDDPSLDIDLVGTDYLADYSFEYQTVSEYEVLATLNTDSVVIKNASDEVITHAYDINPVSKTIILTQRNISLKFLDAKKAYDGKALSSNSYELISGSLLPGQVLEVKANSTQTQVGTSLNKDFTFKILEDDVDVTHLYNITYEEATLQVEEMDLVVQTGSKEFVFDNVAFVCNEFKLVDGSLANEDYLEIIENTKAIKAGNYANVLKAIVKDKDGNDVTANYNISYNLGTIEIKKQKIAIRTFSSSKDYDGIALISTGYELISGELVNDAVLALKSGIEPAQLINAGTIENANSYDVICGEDNLTENYEIEYVYGSLTINKRKITLDSFDMSFIYDATAKTYEEYMYHANSLQVIARDRLNVLFTSSITNVGEVENAFEVEILSASGEDITNNYDIAKNYGVLKVEKRQVIIKPKNITKIYDGTPLSAGDYEVVNSSLSYVLVAGHYAEASVSSQIINVGIANSEIDECSIFIEGTNENVTDNYEIIYQTGIIEVIKRPLSIEASSSKKVFDGTALENSNWQYASQSLQTVLNHTIVVTTAGTITYVGTAVNEIQEVNIYDDTTLINYNYEVSFITGTLEIEKRPITIKPIDKQMEYNGEILSNNEWEYLPNSLQLLSNHTLQCITDGRVSDAITVTNSIISFSITDGNGENVAENYLVNLIDGELTVSKRLITIQANDASKVFNGIPLTSDTFRIISGTLVNGQSITITTKGTRVYVGTSENEIGSHNIYDNTRNYNDNYEVTYVSGSLKVSPLQVTIRAKSAKSVYTAEPFVYHEWEYSGDNKIVIGHYIEATFVGQQIEIGESPNKVTVKVYDQYTNEEMTYNYDLNYEDGKLEVTVCELIIKPVDETKVYDKLPLTSTKGECYSGIIGKNHEIVITTSGSITDVGTTEAVITTCQIMENGNDVTANYNIGYRSGKLTVTPREITIQGENKHWTYDGLAHSYHEWQYADNSLELVGNDRIESLEYLSEIILAGELPNIIRDAVINDGTKDVTTNYLINYSKAGTLIVHKRMITLVSGDFSKIYDGFPAQNTEITFASNSQALVDGHVLQTEFTSNLVDVGSADNTFVSKVLYCDEGDDASDNYDIDYKYGKLEVRKRTISIITGSAEKVYNGKVMRNSKWEYINSSDPLVEGHYIKVTSHVSIIDVGEIANEATITIYMTVTYEGEEPDVEPEVPVDPVVPVEPASSILLLTTASSDSTTDTGTDTNPDAGGETTPDDPDDPSTEPEDEPDPNDPIIGKYDVNVTDNYSITQESGILKVTKRPVKFDSESANSVYDGKAFKCERVSISDEEGYMPLADNHTFEATNFATITDVGSTQNTFQIKIFDAKGKNVTENYEIELGLGALEVAKRPISIKPGDKDISYGGELGEFECKFLNNTSLAENHRIEIEVRMLSYNVGETNESEITKFTIFDAGGKEVTNNYAVTADKGSVVITKRRLNITLIDAEKVYDGKALTSEEIYCDNLVDGHRVEITAEGSQTAAGSSENNIIGYQIFDEKEVDVTVNYEVTTYTGTLTVSKRKVTFDVGSLETVYDGQEHKENSWKYAVNSENELAPDQYMACEYPASLTNVFYKGAGSDRVVSEIANTMENIVITAFDKENVTANYDITVNQGYIRINPRPITIVSGTAGKVYDGTELTCDESEVTYTEEYPRLAGHLASALIESTITEVGCIDNVITKGTVVFNSQEVSDNYDFTLIFGTLTITPRKLTIKADDKTKVYDGTPLECNSWSYVEGSLKIVDWHSATATYTGKITDVGSIPCSVSLQILDTTSESRDVTHNYEIEYIEGKLEITRLAIKVVADSADKIYDGVLLTKNTYHYGSEQQVLDGHELIVTISGSILHVGSVPNTITAIIKDNEGKEITDNYEIVLVDGTLTINPIVVYYTSADAKKAYDGEPLTNGNWQLVSGTLLAGHTSSVQVTGTITTIGSTENNIEVRILDKDGYDISRDYEIHTTPGTLTVYDGTLKDEAMSGVIAESPFEQSEEVYAKIISSTTGTVYLRYTSYGEYNGNGWDVASSYETDELNPLYLTTLALANASKTSADLAIEIEKAGLTDLLAYYTSTYFDDYSDVMLQNKLDKYSISYIPYVYDNQTYSLPAQYHDFEGSYRNYVYDAYLQLTEQAKLTAQSIINDMGWTKSTSNVINLVQDYIKAKFTYNLEFDYSGKSFEMDIATYLLTEATEGICQHYATAATVLYRALGIPARYVVGYVGEVKQAYATTNITGKQAHAWVEVYIDGMGWVQVEVTGTGFNKGDENKTEKPTLELTPINQQKVYDAKVLTCPNDAYTITYGILPAGYTIKAVIEGSITDVGVTESQIASYFIYNEKGEDISESFNVILNPGELKVIPIEITVKTGSAEKPYDGEELTCNEHKIVSGETLNGHELHIAVTGSITNVGKTNNTFEAILLDANGNNVISNYSIIPDLGTLIITGNVINISSDSAEKRYDGTPLIKHDFTYEGTLLDGHRIVPVFSGTITDPGSVDNVFTATILNEKNENVTTNYIVETTYGTLTIAKNQFTISSNSAEKEYDGNPLTSHTVTQDGVLLPNHHLDIQYTGLITEIGTTSNTFSVKILDEENIDVTDFYELVINTGVLEVTKRHITILTQSAEKEYDGTPLTKEEFALVLGSLLDGHTISANFLSSITNYGAVANEAEFKIFANNSTDVSSYYEITTEFGKLRINRAALEIQSGSCTREYDGTPLIYKNYELIGNLPAGYTIQPTFTSSITDVGQISNDFSVIILDKNKSDVTDEFSIKYTTGLLEVIARQITVSSRSAEKEYDGSPLVCHEYQVTSGSIVEGDNLVAIFTGSITEAGSVSNEFRLFKQILPVYNIEDAIPTNYDITYEYGTLTVIDNRIILTFTPYSITKVYDGIAFAYEANQFWCSNPEAIAGYTVSVEYSTAFISGSSINVGKGVGVITKVKIMSENNDITDTFKYDLQEAEIEITKRKIIIVSDSAMKYFDETALEANTYRLQSNKIAETDRLEVSITGSVVGVINKTTTVNNTIDKENTRIYCGGIDVTDNYSISYKEGTLTVLPLEF